MGKVTPTGRTPGRPVLQRLPVKETPEGRAIIDATKTAYGIPLQALAQAPDLTDLELRILASQKKRKR